MPNTPRTPRPPTPPRPPGPVPPARVREPFLLNEYVDDPMDREHNAAINESRHPMAAIRARFSEADALRDETPERTVRRHAAMSDHAA